MATKTITIQGLNFDVTAPYGEGHQITEAEAKALNQVRAENIRNNFAKRIKDAKEKHGDELPQEVVQELTAAVAEYDASYEFTLANTGNGAARVTDPVEREALSLARGAIRAKAKESGKRILPANHEGEVGENDITKERFDELVAELAAREDVQKLARKRVKDEQALLAA